MKVTLGLDDFSVVNNRLDLLLKLKSKFSDFKVSLFTVPEDIRTDWGPYTVRKDTLLKIRENLDWLQIIPHGLTHTGSELKRCDYATFKYEIMPRIKQAFDRDGLPFVRGFKAPHYYWTDGVVKALNEEGWWGAIDRDKIMPTPKSFYRYSYRINEPFLESEAEELKLNGHIYGTENDLGKCLDSLLKLPQDTEWHFVTDFLNG